MGRLRCSLTETLTPFFFFFVCFFFFFFFFFFFRFAAADFNISTLSFEEGYSHLFGDGNLVRSPDDRSVRLLLNVYTGAGFISSSMYQHGFFSAKIKLPSDYTAGIVVAFYSISIHLSTWKMTSQLPSQILLSIINYISSFYIDEVPIREVVRVDEMGGDYPSKPMALYATIWDASSWATNGGKHKVDYRYAPFSSEFKELVLDGCPMDPIQEFPNSTACSDDAAWLDGRDYAVITPTRRAAMRKFRQHYMYYAYCYDKLRYPVTPPECVIDPIEQERFQESGRLRYGGSHRKEAKIAKITRAARRKRRSRGSASISNGQASK
ncbi:Concanavalin A-like lectin/glucanases superfamily [Corchorus capsularis]|uniref:Xyloglucan endotransglucosylase/hydrolase n=1 Tax=Corchorus capsularis TaxID=210143 RepID=A0A1R3I443_COCAP|nr:Concanavalin A-like lectin/glucanases superfamily [Corchorus capsularis]